MSTLCFTAAYALAAFFSLETTQSSNGIAVVWPPSGIALAALLLLPRKRYAALLVLLSAGSLAANMAYGASLGVAAAFTVANLCEVVIAYRFIRTRENELFAFDRPRWVARFALGASVAAGCSAAIAMVLTRPPDQLDFFMSWLATVLLGMLIVTPAIVTTARAVAVRGNVPIAWLHIVLIYSAGFMLTVMALFQNTLPLLFVPMAMVVLATYSLGMAGAIGMIVIVTVVGSVALIGEFDNATTLDDSWQAILFFQGYLVVLLASALPLATLLGRTRRQNEELERSHTLLSAAERIANVGHYRYDLENETLFWSEEMYRIHGMEPGTPIAFEEATDMCIESDRDQVRAVLARSIENRDEFHFQATIRRRDDELRVVESNGQIEFEGDRMVALFGVLLDVTERVEAMRGLAEARELAESEARKAVALAETDQLTGVANRRKLLATLEAGIALAERQGTPLSVVMIDVDHFKAINDTYGHAAGDLVLREIAGTCVAGLRASDLFGRLGGEEFLAILPGAGERRAVQAADRLRQRVAQLRFEGDYTELGPVSISLGVAVFRPGANGSWLLQAADGALYRSKKEGRNRLSVAA